MINDCFDELTDITLAELNSPWIPVSPPPWEEVLDAPPHIISEKPVLHPFYLHNRSSELHLELPATLLMDDDLASSQSVKESLEPLPIEMTSEMQEPNVENGGHEAESKPAVIEDKEPVIENDGCGEIEAKPAVIQGTMDSNIENDEGHHGDGEHGDGEPVLQAVVIEDQESKTEKDGSDVQEQTQQMDSEVKDSTDSEPVVANEIRHEGNELKHTAQVWPCSVQVETTTHDVDVGSDEKEIQKHEIADKLNNTKKGFKNNSTPKAEVKVPIPMQPIVKEPPPSKNHIVDPVFYSDPENRPIGVKLHKPTNRLLYDQNLETIGAAAKGNGRDVARYGTGDEDLELGTLVRMFDSISKMMYTGTVCDKWDGVYSNKPWEDMGRHYYLLFDPMPNVDFSDYANVAFPQSQLQLFNGKKLDTRSVPRRGRKPSGYDFHYYSPSTLPEGVIVELDGYEGIDFIVAGKIGREKGYILNRFNTRTGTVKGPRTSFVFAHYEQLADLTPELKKKFNSWINKRESGDKLMLGAEASDLSKERQTQLSNQSGSADDSSFQETDSLASESSGRGSATASELQLPVAKLKNRRKKLSKDKSPQGSEQNSEEPEVEKKSVEKTESKKPNKKKETPAGGQRGGAPKNPTEMVQCHDHVSAAAHNSLEKHCSELQADLAAALREKAELAQKLNDTKVDQSSSGATTSTMNTATIMEANLKIAQLKDLVDQLTGFLQDYQNSKATGASAAELISKTVPHARKRVQQKHVQEDSNGVKPMDLDENEFEECLRQVVIDNEEEGQLQHTPIKTPSLLFTPSPARKRLALEQARSKFPTRQTSQTRILPTRNRSSSQDQRGIQSNGYFGHENSRVSTEVTRGPYSRDNSPTTHLLPQTRISGPTPSSSGYMINQSPFQVQRGNNSMSNRVVAAEVSVDPSHVDQCIANVANRPDGRMSMAQVDLEGIIRTPENEDPHSLVFETTEFHEAAQMVCDVLLIPVQQGSLMERAIKTAFWCEAIREDMDPNDVVRIMTAFERFHNWMSKDTKPIDICCKLVKRFVGRYKTRAPAKRPLDGGYNIRPQFKIPRGLTSPHSVPLPNPPIRGGRRAIGRPKNSGAFCSMVSKQGTPPPSPLTMRGPNGRDILVQTRGAVFSYPKGRPTPDHNPNAALLDQDDDETIEVDDAIEDENWQKQQANSRNTKAPSSHVKKKTQAQCMTYNTGGYQLLDPRLEALFEQYMGYFTEMQLMSLEQTSLKPQKGQHNTIVQTGKAIMYRMMTYLAQNSCQEFTIPGYDFAPFLIAMKMCSNIGPNIRRDADCVVQMEVIVIESPLLWACLVKIIRILKPMANQLPPTGVCMFTNLPKIVLAHFVRMVRQAYLRAGERIPHIPQLVQFDNVNMAPQDNVAFVEQEEEYEEEPHEVLDVNNWPQAPLQYHDQNGPLSGDVSSGGGELEDDQEPVNSPNLQ